MTLQEKIFGVRPDERSYRECDDCGTVWLEIELETTFKNKEVKYLCPNCIRSCND